MFASIAAIVAGLGLLAWAADRFVLGAAATARYAGIPPLLVGMVVIGFGTSAPELVVSVFAAADGNSPLALGNAFGSNIANIALILGITAALSPIAVHRGILRKEIPVLIGATALAAFLLSDGNLSRIDAITLLAVFGGLLGWSIWHGMRDKGDPLAADVERSAVEHALSRRAAMLWLWVGLVVLVLASRLLVWGAVDVAQRAGLSDLVIGLTVVAIGTSLPELASSIAAARKGENDLALGNIIGSCLFNGLAVVGLAGLIAPTPVDGLIVSRDILTLGLLTVALALFAYRRGGHGVINRWEGAALLGAFVAYSAYLLATAV